MLSNKVLRAFYIMIATPLSTLYNSLILKGLKFNNFLAKNCKPSIYRALEKRVESQVQIIAFIKNLTKKLLNFKKLFDSFMHYPHHYCIG
jgi:hypothetical protein